MVVCCVGLLLIVVVGVRSVVKKHTHTLIAIDQKRLYRQLYIESGLVFPILCIGC